MLFLLAATSLLADPPAAYEPWKPVPVPEASWYRAASLRNGLLQRKPARVVFLGDSLTEFWPHHGRASWTAEFGTLQAVNLGLAADRVENVHQRLLNANLRRPGVEVVVLLAGTNNLAGDAAATPETVARGILALAAKIRHKAPAAQVVVVSIPPSGYEAGTPLRQRIIATNKILSEKLAGEKGYHWIDFHDLLLDAAGLWKEGFTIDGTHFDAAGYEVMGKAIGPVLRELVPDPAKQN